MASKNKRTRQGIPCEICRLDLHGWNGELINRIKCKVTEKDKGILMILNIQRSFDINLMDITKFKDREIKSIIEPIPIMPLTNNKVSEPNELPKPFKQKEKLSELSKPLRPWKM